MRNPASEAPSALRHIKHPFPPLIDGGCQTLILGSVPSVKSVERDFYYMHPQNRFWKVMENLLNEPLYGADNRVKTEILLRNNIALYDSVEECDIAGSSDSKIFNVIPADIPRLLQMSKIRRILCNGQASYFNLIKYYPIYSAITRKLLSTSPANAAYSLDRLIEEWRLALFGG